MTQHLSRQKLQELTAPEAERCAAPGQPRLRMRWIIDPDTRHPVVSWVSAEDARVLVALQTS